MFLWKSYNGLDLHTGATPVLKIAPGILRGMADMGLGILGYKISENKTIPYKGILRIVIIGILWIIIFYFPHSDLDFIFVFFVLLLILLEFSETYTNKKRSTFHLRKLSLGIYFCHSYIILLWKDWKEIMDSFTRGEMWKTMLLYLIIVILFAEIMNLIINRRKSVKGKK